MPAPSTAPPPVPEETRQENKSPVVDEAAILPTPTYEEPAPSAHAPVSPKVTRVERKPVNETKVHPAFRNQPPEPLTVETSPTSQQQPGKTGPAQVAAARAFWQSQVKPTDEAAVSDAKEPKRLHKKERGVPTAGALKKMFGRKKEDTGAKSMDTATRERTLAPPSEASVGRRLSLMRKKPVSRGAESVSAPAPVNEGFAEQHQPVSPVAPERPSVSEYAPSEHEVLTRTDTMDTDNAKQEFARFDQGPLTEAPTFVPGSPVSPLEYEHFDPDRTPYADRTQGSDYVSSQRPQLEAQHESIYTTPMEAGEQQHTRYDAGDDQGNYEAEAPVMDRWAQIRKNAAERAARVSEEQSMRSRGQSVATEGASETSGEESKFYPGQIEGHVLIRHSDRRKSRPYQGSRCRTHRQHDSSRRSCAQTARTCMKHCALETRKSPVITACISREWKILDTQNWSIHTILFPFDSTFKSILYFKSTSGGSVDSVIPTVTDGDVP